jgi:hypothetical protein
MATPTVYTWMDTGAPLATSNADYMGHKALLDILKACLVDGYGDKPAAGWTLEHWDDATVGGERAAFGNGNGIIELIGRGTAGTSFVLHESVTTWGVGNLDGTGGEGLAAESCWSEGVNSQCGYNSDYARDTTTGYISSIYSHYFSYAQLGTELDSLGWIVIATDKTFLAFQLSNPDGTSTATSASSAAYQPVFYNGVVAGAVNHTGMARDDVGNFMVFSAYPYASKSVVSTTNRVGLGDSGVSLKNPFGADKSSSDLITLFTYDSAFHSSNYKSPIVLHDPYVIYYSGDYNPDTYNSEEYLFATLPGVRVAAGTTPVLSVRDQLEKMESTGVGRKYMDWVTFDGYECFPVTIDDNNEIPSSFISTNPAYWP